MKINHIGRIGYQVELQGSRYQLDAHVDTQSVEAVGWKDASTGVDRMRCKLAFRGPGVTLETPGRGSVHRLLLLPLF